MIVLDAHSSHRLGFFDVSFEGRYLLSSASPLQDAARILLRQGISPKKTLLLRRSDGVEEKGNLGVCAVGGGGDITSD